MRIRRRAPTENDVMEIQLPGLHPVMVIEVVRESAYESERLMMRDIPLEYMLVSVDDSFANGGGISIWSKCVRGGNFNPPGGNTRPLLQWMFDNLKDNVDEG